MKTKNLKVVIVDDHTLFRKGIETLLRNRGVEVLSSEGNGADGVSRVLLLRPDMVLLDLRMPDMNGIEVLHALRGKKFDAPIVVLTMSRNEKDFRECMKGGADGYLLKDMDPDELASAMRQIYEGQTMISPVMQPYLDKMKDEREPRPWDDQIQKLTPREKQVLSLLAEGFSNKKIASRYDISDGTVKLHVKSILKKLRVHSRVEAAVIALEEMNRKTF